MEKKIQLLTAVRKFLYTDNMEQDQDEWLSQKLIQLMNDLLYITQCNIIEYELIPEFIEILPLGTFKNHNPALQKAYDLDSILIKYFGSGYPMPDVTTCDSYEKLVNLLYGIYQVIPYEVDGLIRTLDEISNENCFYSFGFLE